MVMTMVDNDWGGVSRGAFCGMALGGPRKASRARVPGASRDGDYQTCVDVDLSVEPGADKPPLGWASVPRADVGCVGLDVRWCSW